MYKLGEKVYFLTNTTLTEFSFYRQPEDCFYMREGIITDLPVDDNMEYYRVNKLGVNKDDIIRFDERLERKSREKRIITIGRIIHHKYSNNRLNKIRYLEFIPEVNQSISDILKKLGRITE